MKSLVLFPSIILLYSSFLSGQNFEVTVSTDSVLLGNYIEVSFKVENLDGNFEAPEFTDMDIISGPNTSSSIQIINGEKSSQLSYSYYLKPRDVGSHTIPPAYLITEEQTLETLPLVINVYPNPENIITEPQMAEDRMFFNFDDWSPFTRPQQPSIPNPPAAPAKKKRKYKRI